MDPWPHGDKQDLPDQPPGVSSVSIRNHTPEGARSMIDQQKELWNIAIASDSFHVPSTGASNAH